MKRFSIIHQGTKGISSSILYAGWLESKKVGLSQRQSNLIRALGVETMRHRGIQVHTSIVRWAKSLLSHPVAFAIESASPWKKYVSLLPVGASRSLAIGAAIYHNACIPLLNREKIAKRPGTTRLSWTRSESQRYYIDNEQPGMRGASFALDP